MMRVVLALLGVLLLSAGSARAASHEAHKKAAYAAFELGKYGEAIARFEEAYELKRDPRLLYNIALAYYRRYELHRAPTDLQQARNLFRRFLLLVPTPRRGADRARVADARRYSEDFLRKIDEALRSPPTTRSTDGPSTQPGLQRADVLPPTSAPTSRPLLVDPTPPDVKRRGPVTPWVLYGVAVGAGAAAAITGVLALRADTRSDELAADGDVAANAEASRARRFALTTDVLLGAGLASAVIGVILHLRAPAREERRDEARRRWSLRWAGSALSLLACF